MPKEALRDALASLHAELGTADKLDAESRALLSTALREIADRLDRDEPDAESETLGDTIRGAVQRFEGEHPELVSAVARVAEALGAAGI
jgi:Flp pilus assembly protein CpaB